MRLTRRTLDQIYSPIGAAFALVPQRTSERRMLDLSQAAPSCPPPPAIQRHLATVAASADGGRYAPQEGIPTLRSALAAELSGAYRGSVDPAQIMITAGCNQAFSLVSSALCDVGDRVMLPVPFYFNHDMWLRLDNLNVDHLTPTDASLIPDPDAAEALLTDRTRAIVLVTPGNPSGVTVPPEVIHRFAELARRRDLMLIVDETYRSFRQTDEPAHNLFAQPGWDDHVVSLHSFSKEFAIPGYRVGAAVGHPDLLAEAMKLLDCVAICAPRIGQEAALAGLTQATDWRAEQAERVAGLQARFETALGERPGGFELVTAGAYFGWIRHPYRDLDGAIIPADDVVKRLLFHHDLLTIPGTAFTPDDQGMVRMSFANLEPADIDLLAERLAESPPSDQGRAASKVE